MPPSESFSETPPAGNGHGARETSPAGRRDGSRPKWTKVLRLLVLCLAAAALVAAPRGMVAGPEAAAVQRAEQGEEVRAAISSGRQLERSGRWREAIDHYEGALERWPESKQIQYGLRRAKIHFGIERRYTDDSFEKVLIRKPRQEALALFEEVYGSVRSNYVENVSATSFLAHGTESLYLALGNDKFVEHNLAGVEPERIQRMRRILREQYWNKAVADPGEARQTVDRVSDIARSLLGLPAGPVVMEYVFGGCNVLDDYSNYLTPDRLEDLYGNIDGEFVGLGIEMKAEAGKGMHLVNVLPDSPASDAGLLIGDYIVAIDGTDCRRMTTDEAARLLRGPEGSRVEIGFRSLEEEQPRYRTLIRREVHVKSIPVAKIIDAENGIGYIRMSGFQRTSAKEMDEALSRLHQQGMRALVWDLRGNPGGLLTAAVEVLDRFINEGVLVSTRGRTQSQNWTYSAHRPGTWKVPLTLLVDDGSASASEIVAGAVADHRRGLIVGRTTYGKWSVQSIFSLSESTGMRLTTAKFYSPNGRTLGKIGVKPDVPVALAQSRETLYRPGTVNVDSDADVKKAVQLLRGQLARQGSLRE